MRSDVAAVPAPLAAAAGGLTIVGVSIIGSIAPAANANFEKWKTHQAWKEPLMP